MDVKELHTNRLVQNGIMTLKVWQVTPHEVIVDQVIPVPSRPLRNAYGLARVADWRLVTEDEYRAYLVAYDIGVR